MTRAPARQIPRVHAVAALTGVLLGLASCWAHPAPAAAAGDPVRLLAAQLAHQAAAPWPGHQRENGSWRDRIKWPTAYGEAALGAALLDTGVRQHDKRMVGSALRGLQWVIEHRFKRRYPSVFQNMTMSIAYNVARRRLGNDQRFLSMAGGFRRLLRHQLIRRLKRVTHFGNHQLVEAIEMLELERTGLRSSYARGALGPIRDEYISRAIALLQERIPGNATRETVRVGGDATFLLSDPPDEPSTYHGLTTGLYARGLELMGARARPFTRAVLGRAAEASWYMAAPDGDQGYLGRNQEESWVLSSTAYGAYRAATTPGVSRARRARFLGVAQRALQRLSLVYAGGPDGLYIIPGLRRDLVRGGAATDPSSGSAEFVGLTLLFLNWIADSPARKLPPPGPVASDRDGTHLLGRGASLRGLVRRGDVWLAVRPAISASRPDDLRYDGGLIALKHRRADGLWHDVIPGRPFVSLPGPADSAGPLLLGSAGRAVFAGQGIRRGSGGALKVVGAYRRLGGVAPAGHGGVERIAPVDCGARVSFAVRAGERVEYSVFLSQDGDPAIDAGSVTSGNTRVSFTPGAKVAIGRDYISATDPWVLRARLRWREEKHQTVSVIICDNSS